MKNNTIKEKGLRVCIYIGFIDSSNTNLVCIALTKFETIFLLGYDFEARFTAITENLISNKIENIKPAHLTIKKFNIIRYLYRKRLCIIEELTTR